MRNLYVQYTSVMQRYLTISTLTVLENCLIKWQDKIPNTEVLKKAIVQSMRTVLKLAPLRWTGHVIRMPDEGLPKKVFIGELQGEALSRWPEETLQRHPQSIYERFRHTIRVFGTDCTGAIKVVRSHQQRSSSL